MAGRRPKQPEAVIPTTAVVASAVRYPGNVPRIFHPSQPWQQEAYRYYGIIGEARFAANYMGNSMSRVTLSAGDLKNGVVVPAGPNDNSTRILSELFGGPEGQAGMLKLVGIHLTVAGECYIVGRAPTGILERDRGADPDVETIWEVVSVTEMTSAGSSWVIRYGDGHPDVPLADDDVVIRVWNPDPNRRMEADSPFKSNLPVLSEIEYLTLHIFAQCRSRLAGAGILWVPSEMDFPPPPNNADGSPMEISTAAEGLMLRLADAMVEDIHDQGDANSVVPVALSAPGESIDKAKLMHFWSNLDEKALEMRAAAIHRFAVGMDIPPEQVLGMSSNGGTGGGTSNGVSHWGAWQIDESTIKLGIEPMATAFASAITISYLRPGGAPDSSVLFDTSSLRLRPDRSEESMSLWDRGVLKTEVMLRENGFSVEDMPDAEEVKQWFLRKVAGGSATPEQVGAALEQIGVTLNLAPGAMGTTVRETRPDPTLDGLEERRAPERNLNLPEAASAHDMVLLNVANTLVFRALERAGNRLRQNVGKPPGCPSWETHTLVKANGTTDAVLNDAFGSADQVLDGVADSKHLVPILEAYARTLITEQSAHDKARLEQWLRTAGAVA